MEQNRIERNTRERIRRQNMKRLLESLAPLVHPQPSTLSVPELLRHTTSHIKEMQRRIEELKRMKEGEYGEVKSSSSPSRMPVIDLQSNDSILEVNVVTGLTNNFMSHQLISIIQEAGGAVISFSCHSAGDSVIYTIRSQAISSRIGVEISSIRQKLINLIY